MKRFHLHDLGKHLARWKHLPSEMACRAIIPLMPYPDDRVDHFTFEDRERIVTLKVKFEGMCNQIDELKDLITDSNITAKQDYNALVATVRSDNTALALRVTALENFRWWVLGGAAVIGTAIHFIFEYWNPSRPFPGYLP